MSGVLGSLIKRDSANFKKESSKIFAIVFLSNVNALLLSTPLKFEISVFFGMSRDFNVSPSSFGGPIYSESYHQKMLVFLLRLIFMYCILLFIQLFINMKSRFVKSIKKLVPSVHIFLKFSIRLFFSIFLDPFDPSGLTRCDIVNDSPYVLFLSQRSRSLSNRISESVIN